MNQKQIDKWLKFSGQSAHAVLPVIGERQAAEMGFERFKEAVALREEVVVNERSDRLRNGWEPPIWKVCDALLGLPCFDVKFEEQVKKRFGWDWDTWCEMMRLHLGFDRPVQVLLISGPNRSGKTEYAAKRANQIGLYFDDEMVWCFAQTSSNSVEIQQVALHTYLPAELRGKDVRTRSAYIKYSLHDGFTGENYVLPTGTRISLRNYMQKEETLEGPPLKFVWGDELIPPHFQKTLEGRIADRNGWMVDTFTPVRGWSATVNMFLEGADRTRECIAYLLPADGGEPDEVRAFGFESEEQMAAARMYNPKATVPEDVNLWLEGKRSQPACPEGRKFEVMPRVMKCFNRNRAVVFFQPMDNPFGNPPAVWQLWRYANNKSKRERLYGFAEKTVACQFPLFSESVHVIDPEKIPAEGTNYQVIDPTPGGRPFFMIWIRVTKFARYIYREWPQADPSPDDGVPFGNWAEPSGRRNGINDGDFAEAADPIGWGVDRYVREFARLERWKDGWEERIPVAEELSDRAAYGTEEDRGWNKIARYEAAADGGEVLRPDDGAEEEIELRLIDSRAASSPKIEHNRLTTLYEMFAETGLEMQLTEGTEVDERVRLVNHALYYESGSDGKEGLAPRLFVSARCRNVIFAMQNWKGAEGLKGATKDPCDCVGYGEAAMLEYVEPRTARGPFYDGGGSPY